MIVNKIETYNYGPDPVPGHLTWSMVGVRVFARIIDEEEVEIPKKDIFGKAQRVGNVILSVPKKVLMEK